MDILLALILLIFGIDLDVDYYNAGIALGLTALNLLCLIPVIFLINNYLPFLIGKKGFKTPWKNFSDWDNFFLNFESASKKTSIQTLLWTRRIF